MRYLLIQEDTTVKVAQFKGAKNFGVKTLQANKKRKNILRERGSYFFDALATNYADACKEAHEHTLYLNT